MSETFIFYSQVNDTDVSNMGHTEVVDLVRAAPRVVDLVVGRVLEAPKPPIEAHLLPDICFKGNQEPLGKKQPVSHDTPPSTCLKLRHLCLSFVCLANLPRCYIRD